MTAVHEFDPYSETYFEDPYETYRWLRDDAPVYRNDHYGFYALSRYDDVLAAHRDWQTFTSTHGVTIDQLVDPYAREMIRGSIIFMDPPEHDRLRQIVSRVFTPKAVADLEPMIRRVVNGYLDAVDPSAATDGGAATVDLVADFSAPFPVEVICEILGVPAGEERQQIRHWTDAVLHREPGNPKPTQEGMEAMLYQVAYLHELTGEKRRQPADDMLSALIDAGLTDDEIAGFAGLLAAAGSETVTKLIGNGVVLFHRNPDEWAKVCADRSLLIPAMEEVLRFWAPSQYQGRWSTVDTEWHGVTIPAEQPVLLITGAANRDERSYPDADRFLVERPLKLNVGFGHGIHTCLGAALARLESRIAFDEIANRWPSYEVDEAGCRRVHMSNVAGYSNVPVRL